MSAASIAPGDNMQRLYRSKENKVIGGVCGGIGEYFDIDPVWVRLVFVLLIFADGIGILAYLIAWIMIPKNPEQKEMKKTKAEVVAEKVTTKVEKVAGRRYSESTFILGVIIVLIGVAFLMHSMFSWFSFHYVWPAAIILLGLYLVVKK
jgi:phage shock protein C